MKKIHNIISTAILATIMTYSTPAKADFITGEVFGNNKGALIEVKGSASIGDQPNAQYFTRIRRFRSYDNKNTSFMQNELSLGTIAGFRLLAQARLAGDTLIPQTGVSYSVKGENGSLYTALTSSLQQPALPELLMLATIPLAQHIPVELEQIVSANSNVFKATSRAHLGYTIGNFTCGIAAEADYGKKIPFIPKAGLYLRLKSR